MKRALAIILALGGGPATGASLLDGRDIANGAALYAQHCAACHGAQLEGQRDWQTKDENDVFPAPPHDETGHTWHHSDADLIAYTMRGGQALIDEWGLTGVTSGMPAYDGILTEGEVRDVLAFIRSTWPEEIRRIQTGRNP